MAAKQMSEHHRTILVLLRPQTSGQIIANHRLVLGRYVFFFLSFLTEPLGILSARADDVASFHALLHNSHRRHSQR